MAVGQAYFPIIFQLALEFRRGRLAFGRIPGHGLQNDLLNRQTELGAEDPGGHGVSSRPSIHDNVGAVALERYPSRRHFIQNRADTRDVGPVIAPLAPDLLRSHVVGCAEVGGQAREGQPAPIGGHGRSRSRAGAGCRRGTA